MIDTKELRRLAQAATPGPWKMLPVGDGRQKFAVADRKSLSILTVTDEGEATFGTVYDDADAKFIAAANPAAISEILDRLEVAEKECDALRAKIAETERQEPAGYGVRYVEPTNGEKDWDSIWKYRVFAEDHIKDFTQVYADVGEPVGAITVVPLYLLPVAQPAQSVPEGWQLVPTAESRHPGIYRMLGALHAADNTPGMSEWESYRAMLSEAPEAKP